MKWVRKISANVLGRDFVVGDLHGHLDELKKLLNQVSFDETKDRLFSVGDLIDRGPKSFETLQLMFEPWFFAVRGNHEDMFCYAYGKIASISHDAAFSKSMHETHGGHWAVIAERDYGYALMEDLAKQIDNRLPLVFVVGEGEHRFHVVHAELAGSINITLDDKVLDDMSLYMSMETMFERFDEKCMWSRSLARSRRSDNVSKTISPTYSGHSITHNAPHQLCHQILIDSGCYEDRKLTMVEPKTGQFWSVNKIH